MGRAVLGDPPVVRVEARFLVVEVLVVAELHPDGRVQHLGRDPVASLIGEAGLGIPAAPVQVLESHASDADLLRGLARRGHQPHRYGRLHPRDHEEITDLVAHELEARGVVAVLGVDAVDVGVGRLGDVRIGGDHSKVHGTDGTPGPGTRAQLRNSGRTSAANRWIAARASPGSAPRVGPVTISLSTPRSTSSRRRPTHVSGVPTMPKRSTNSGVSVAAWGDPTWV